MDTVTLLEKLITFRSTADRPDQIIEICGYIEKLLKKKGIYVKRHLLEGKPVLYACTKRLTRPELLLVPHLDVVEGDDDQFKPTVRSGRMYGRGAADCKCNAAVTLRTLLALAGTGAPVGALFSTDEEIGGATTRFMVKKGYVGKINLMLDSDQEVAFRQKGVINLRVDVKGKSAHGSAVWKGENANEKLMDVYARIQKLFPPTTAANRWKRTVNLGIMEGGDTINKVAAHASMQLNIRYTEKDDYRRLISRIRKIKGIAKVTRLGHHPFFYTDPQSGAVKTYRRVMEKQLGRTLSLVSMHGATDAHNFAGTGKPVIISGVGNDRNMHGKNESVGLKGMREFEKALLVYVRTVTGA